MERNDQELIINCLNGDGVLKKLSLPQREILLLHYGEHLTFDEIGKILGEPLNTVKSRHRRALLELRKF